MKLELRGLTKRFGSFVANDHIDVTFTPGTIHAILGENGAGKSTLVNMIYGLYQPDGGQIFIDDEQVHFSDPGEAMATGIGMVHQHFMLVPVFTVAENVVLGHEPTGFGGVISITEARTLVRDISARFGFEVDPDAYIEDLPVGVQQRVEIIKALSRDAQILILDEPTAVLTPQETDELIETMRQLRDSGTSIVFITHKLREVKAVADEITVIRRGRVVGTVEPSAPETELASFMVGRAVSLGVDKDPAQTNDQQINIRGLSVLDSIEKTVVDNVSFTVNGGEIFAVAGVQGNGQTELVETILGLRTAASGSVSLNGTELLGKSVKEVLNSGVGFVPEDRSTDGLIDSFTIAENMVLDQHDRPPFAKGLALNLSKIYAHAEANRQAYDVRAQSIHDPISSLSGGNQQKVVLARGLSRPLELLIASQPTRGLDVGSIEFVHKQVVAERDSGTPVLIVSTELDEVAALADRVAVMYRGEIVGIVPGDTDRDVLGLMMAGVPLHEAQSQAEERPTILRELEGEE